MTFIAMPRYRGGHAASGKGKKYRFGAGLSMASHHPLSILEKGNRQNDRKTQNGLLFRGIFAIIPETTTFTIRAQHDEKISD